jgi:trigger factor
MPEIELPDYKNIEKGKTRLEILEKIIEKMKAEIPQILIEGEKEKMFQEIRANLEETGLKWEDYLGHIKKTEEELKKDWEPDALKRVKFGLVLNEIAEKEKIEVSEEEMEKEAEKIMEQHKYLDKNRVKMYTYGIIRNEKVFKLLESC